MHIPKQGQGGALSHGIASSVPATLQFRLNSARNVFDLLIIRANPPNSDTDLMCQDGCGKFREVSAKSASKCYNLAPPVVDGLDRWEEKANDTSCAVSSDFTLCSRLSKRRQKLKAFFARLMCLDDTTESEQGWNIEQTPNRPSGMRDD